MTQAPHALTHATIPHVEIAPVQPGERWAYTLRCDQMRYARHFKILYGLILGLIFIPPVVITALILVGELPVKSLFMLIFTLSSSLVMYPFVRRQIRPCTIRATDEHLRWSIDALGKPRGELAWSEVSHINQLQHQATYWLVISDRRGKAHSICALDHEPMAFALETLRRTHQARSPHAHVELAAPVDPSSALAQLSAPLPQLRERHEPGRVVLQILPNYHLARRALKLLSILTMIVMGVFIARGWPAAAPQPHPMVRIIFFMCIPIALQMRSGFGYKQLTLLLHERKLRLEDVAPWGARLRLEAPVSGLKLVRGVLIYLQTPSGAMHLLEHKLHAESIERVEALLQWASLQEPAPALPDRSPQRDALQTSDPDALVHAPKVPASVQRLRAFAGWGWRVKLQPTQDMGLLSASTQAHASPQADASPQRALVPSQPIHIATATLAHYSGLYLLTIKRRYEVLPEHPHVLISRSMGTQTFALLSQLSDGRLVETGLAEHRVHDYDLRTDRFIYQICEQPFAQALEAHLARVEQITTTLSLTALPIRDEHQIRTLLQTQLVSESAYNARRFALNLLGMGVMLVSIVVSIVATLLA